MSLIVLGNGKGVNSLAVCIGMKQRGEAIDLILSADTGGEKDSTYLYEKEFFQPWLKANGFPVSIPVKKDGDTLEQECLKKKTLPSIVVGFKSCSDHFKIRPQNNYIKKWAPAIEAWERGEKVVKLVGFDASEAHRVYNADTKKFAIRYPLVEWGWDRARCVQEIRGEGLPIPPKSSCFFCPNMREREIIQLRETEPHNFDRAIAMEKNNTALVTVKGLNRLISWQQIAGFYDSQITLPLLPSSNMPCDCVDGDGDETDD